MPFPRTSTATALTWLAVLAAAAWAYLPGLSGGFLFDDYVNLDALGRNGAISDMQGLWRYLISGTADPLGRPLSLLSFLIDARNWPADPAPFLRTNLLIHLLNGSLLVLLLYRLERAVQSNAERARASALLAAGLWLLHPLWVSTTLYAVQREAMLPASFILLGLIAYTHGRERLSRGQARAGLLWIAAGIVGGTVLAALSKANGLLLPLLALSIEYFVFTPEQNPTSLAPAKSGLRLAKLWLLVIPSLALALYLGHFLMDWNQLDAGKGWTVGQRAMSEPRILFQYLGLLLVPRSVSAGLFNDQVLPSIGLFSPFSTFTSVAGLTVLVVLVFKQRRSAPAFSAAIGFFLAAHLLESSVVPLELYFEHRNYVPALLLGWPLARALVNWKVGAPLRTGVAFALLLLLAATTHSRAAVWGQPRSLAALWALQNPESGRAQAGAAIALLESGQGLKARQLLEPIRRARPYDLQVAVNYLDTLCATSGQLSNGDRIAMAETLSGLPISNDLVFRWFTTAIGNARSGRCKGWDLPAVESWLAAARANPRLGPEFKFEQVAGRLSLSEGKGEAAGAHLTRALHLSLRPEDALRHAAWLAAAGYRDEAFQQLDLYEQLVPGMPSSRPGMPWLHEKLLQRQGYWKQEFAWMREQIRAMDTGAGLPFADGDKK